MSVNPSDDPLFNTTQLFQVNNLHNILLSKFCLNVYVMGGKKSFFFLSSVQALINFVLWAFQLRSGWAEKWGRKILSWRIQFRINGMFLCFFFQMPAAGEFGSYLGLLLNVLFCFIQLSANLDSKCCNSKLNFSLYFQRKANFWVPIASTTSENLFFFQTQKVELDLGVLGDLAVFHVEAENRYERDSVSQQTAKV